MYIRDTITALATVPGISGIAVVRISGPDSFSITDKYFHSHTKISDAAANTLHYGKFIHNEILIDNVIVSVYHEPNSYTGENIAEISCHGGYIVYKKIIELLISSGARPAEAGEFTKRAFINGKIDLTKAEAIADLIHTISRPGAEIAARQLQGRFTERIRECRRKLLDISALLELELDFADEDIDLIKKEKIIEILRETIEYSEKLAGSFESSRILRSGYFISVIGAPNSGKSTLFNYLLNKNRSIVSDIPGTTRDYIEEAIHIGGFPVKLFDTAGIRDSQDSIEIEGIRLVEDILEQSNLVLLLNDLTAEQRNYQEILKKINRHGKKYFILNNKIDKANNIKFKDNEFYISAKTGEGIGRLIKEIEDSIAGSCTAAEDVLLNERHSELLNRSIQSMSMALDSLSSGLDNEIVAIDIRAAAEYFGELTGENWSESVLEHVFGKFCIGK